MYSYRYQNKTQQFIYTVGARNEFALTIKIMSVVSASKNFEPMNWIKKQLKTLLGLTDFLIEKSDNI